MRIGLKITLIVFTALAALEVFAFCSLFLHQRSLAELVNTEGDFPSEVWLQPLENIKIKDHYKIIVVSSSGGGEKTFGYNLVQGARNLGWESLLFESEVGHGEEIERFNPDFMIMLGGQERSKYAQKYKQYSFIDRPYSAMVFYNPYTFKIKLRKIFQRSVDQSSGFLCGFPGIEVFKNVVVEETGREFYGIPFYTYVPKSEYRVLQPKKIAHIGYNIDALRSSDRYKEFFKMLSRDGVLSVYGPEKTWSYIARSWGGFVPNEQMRDIVRESGIVLVLHATMHFSYALLSNRILEAVSANAVVISDRNPAVIEAFGDNVLYIDHTKSSEEIYQQIRAHYDWIQAHPQEVARMTKANHEVFLQKYTAEQGMRNVAKLHEYILSKEKERVTS